MEPEPVNITMINLEGVQALPIAEAQFLLKQLEYRNRLIETYLEYGQVLNMQGKGDEVVQIRMEHAQNGELMQALLYKLQLEALELKRGCIVGLDDPKMESD